MFPRTNTLKNSLQTSIFSTQAMLRRY